MSERIDAIRNRWEPQWVPDDPRWQQAREDVQTLLAAIDGRGLHGRRTNDVKADPRPIRHECPVCWYPNADCLRQDHEERAWCHDAGYPPEDADPSVTK